MVGCTLLSCAGMTVVGVSHHWIPAALGMLLFGLGWTSAFATIQAAAQLVCPAWVRARALSIYQLAQNGALTLGSFGWGWLGGQIGIPHTFLSATGVGLALMVFARFFSIEAIVAAAVRHRSTGPRRCRKRQRPSSSRCCAAPADGSWRSPTIASNPRSGSQFLRLMNELHHVRGRAGAVVWQVYEDVAHPEGWVEVWLMESWTDHLRDSSSTGGYSPGSSASSSTATTGSTAGLVGPYTTSGNMILDKNGHEHFLRGLVRNDSPDTAMIQAKPSIPHVVRAKSLTRGIIQFPGRRVVQEDFGGIDMELEENLRQADVQGQVQIEAGGDGHVDLSQCTEPLHAAGELNIQAADLLFGLLGAVTSWKTKTPPCNTPTSSRSGCALPWIQIPCVAPACRTNTSWEDTSSPRIARDKASFSGG